MKVLSLNKNSQDIQNIIHLVGKVADEKGLSVYLVGGFVRDLILDRENLDLDFCVHGDAIVFAKSMSDVLKADRCQTHKMFSTATLILKDGLRVDFATCRSETYSASGKLPSVRPADLTEDLFRRDFTINAMAMSVNKNRFGELIDPFGGLKDLKNQTLRVLHDQSFMDDSTRILRAIRFEQRFGFFMDPKTLKLLKYRIENRDGDCVSTQRFFNELKKILIEINVEACLKRMKALKAETLLHPDMTWDLKFFSMARRDALKSQDVLSWQMVLLSVLKTQTLKVRQEFVEKL